MTDESFLLVSLDEDKSKKLAQVLSNDTARKILDLMSTKEYVTETELSKQLKIPLSTAHYNMGLLVKAKLVNDDHYTYSKKGKKINHYSLSNKYVIIAPKKSNVLRQKLKEFLPVVLISALGTFALKYFYKPMAKVATFGATRTAVDLVQEESAELVAKAMPEAANTVINSDHNFAMWFFIGSMFALLTYSLISFITKKRK